MREEKEYNKISLKNATIFMQTERSGLMCLNTEKRNKATLHAKPVVSDVCMEKPIL